MNTRYLLSLVLFFATAAQAQTIINPVLDKDFADPTVIHINGRYYAYATQGRGHIQVSVSDDMQHWSDPADALPVKPVWADTHFWAPHVIYDAAMKKYVLFYSGESIAKETGKCLGVAYADRPEGPFTDKGSPLLCGEGFVNIDPMAFVDPKTGKKLLYWGSGFQPIKVQEMTDNWADFKPGSKAQPVVWPGKEKNYTRLIEGAWLDFHDGKYYLYYSGDNCCGKDANYAVLVSRADKATGPFESHGVILEKDSVWNAPGHNSVFKDGKGKNWIAYHAIRAGSGGRVFCLKPLVYEHGWPVVKP